ncbi:MAG: membrane protein insertase YidC [Acidobacteriota bacterium]
MERRVLLAISLSFLVLFLYQALIVPPPPAGNETPGQGPSPSATGAPAAVAPGAAAAAAATPAATPEPSAAAPAVADASERVIAIETALVRAEFSNRGAHILRWVLKRFRNERGEPLDLIPAGVPAPRVLPFALSTESAEETAALNAGLYRVSVRQQEPVSVARHTTVDATGQAVTLVFEFETAEGLRVEKTFGIEPTSYVVTFTARVTRAGQPVNPRVDWGPGLGDEIARMAPGGFLSPSYSYPAQAIYSQAGDVTRVTPASLVPGQSVPGPFRWVGIDDHYFISAFIEPTVPATVEYTPIVVPPAAPGDPPGRYVAYAARFAAPPENVRVYFGPKEFDSLRGIDPDFTKAIHFGIFAWLAAPLLDALKWVHGFVGNWGWAIIVLTVLINIPLLPLRHKSVVSMRRMQELQPQMKAIQDRYKKYKITDPERQKMNQEVMELYRAKGVNPASGCLPMLLTLPFLFAFYSMLSQAIEIRGADFGGWITDLSEHDPLYITPILMGLTMFWQQRITPSTADPTQQKVMMIMPFMFTFMFLWAPSGLVIYWFVSNLFAIGQQYFTNFWLGTPVPVKKS